MRTTAYKLVCFDLDGTLVENCEGKVYWATLYRLFLGPEGERINAVQVERFYRGEISEEEWTDIDMRDFQRHGLRKEDFESAARKHALVTGARETVLELHRSGIKLAVVSGALSILIDTLFPDHPFNDVFAVEPSFDAHGALTGWKPTPYSFGTKHLALRALCEREGLELSEIVFVGDGDNDIEALKEAGLGIAFCPKNEKVAAAADVVVEKRDVQEILKYL
jgi:phosphoserine phosphatase